MVPCLYGSSLFLLSVAFNLTSKTVGAPNYSIGSVMLVGMYVTSIVSRSFWVSPYLVFPVASLVCGCLNWLLYLLVFKPLVRRGRDTVMIVLVSLGFQMILISLLYIALIWLELSFSGVSVLNFVKSFDFQLWSMPGVFLVSVILTLSLLMLMRILHNHTWFGLTLSAFDNNMELTMIQGANPYWYGQVLWLAAGGLAGLAGGLFPLWSCYTISIGYEIMVSVIAACLIGGFGNLWGGFLGSFLVGFLEIVVTIKAQATVGPWIGEYRPLIPMLIIIVMMCLKSRGKRRVNEKNC